MISIIIVNYNTKDLLKRCMESVNAQGIKDIEIIVVDNGSIDGSAEMVKAGYERVKLIENKENLFFCKANNQGIKEAKWDFILCLNSDCALGQGYLQEALSSFELDKKIGMVSGKMLRMDKKTIDSTGLFVARNRKPLERGYGKPDRGQYEKPGYIFGVSGSCMLMKRGMLNDIKDENGYFDETFEIYYEDLDLCWRAQRKGWKSYYNPKAIAYHKRGATAVLHAGINPLGFHRTDSADSLKAGFQHISYELRKKYIRNRYKCITKNDTVTGVMINSPFILLYEIKIYFYLICYKIWDSTWLGS